MSEPGAISNVRMPVVPLTGLRPTSLGNYLATLGLHRVASRQWSRIRLAWRDGIPCLVGGPLSMDELLAELVECARKQAWTTYEANWSGAKKQGTKEKSGKTIATWRAQAPEDVLRRLDAHVLAPRRQVLNPLLGKGEGKIGQRNFVKGWERAVKSLLSPPEGADLKLEAAAFLLGESQSWLVSGLNGACWFSDANKQANSGQSAFRDGQLSPWGMVLACEGIDYFAGAVSRNLGARSKSFGAFPFLTVAAAPKDAGDAGRDGAEIWAPTWSRPTTPEEITALFIRGRAEIKARGAQTPGAFGAAILRRGVDAGVTSFFRFVLGWTTAHDYLEPRLLGEVKVPQHPTADPVKVASDQRRPNKRGVAPSDVAAEVIERALDLWDTLPPDRKKGDRWQFRGLRGPVEAAMTSLAENPQETSRARALADAIASALDRVDRNRSFRKAGVRWRPLPLDWLSVLLGEDASSEARLAAAIVSSFPATLPFTLYRFGVELTSSMAFRVPDHPSPSWVWGGGRLVANLVQVLRRRTLDLSRDSREQAGQVMRQGWHAGLADVDAWLAGTIDENLLCAWLGRFALFDWRGLGERPAALMYDAAPTVLTGTLALHALLLPLLDLRPVRGRKVGDLLSVESGARTPGVAQKLVTLLSIGRVDDAVELARVRYAMGGAPLARWYVNFAAEDPSRFTASLLVPVSDEQRARLIVQRWLRPSRNRGEVRHVHV